MMETCLGGKANPRKQLAQAYPYQQESLEFHLDEANHTGYKTPMIPLKGLGVALTWGSAGEAGLALENSMNIIFLALIQGICRIWVVMIAFGLRSIHLSNRFFS